MKSRKKSSIKLCACTTFQCGLQSHVDPVSQKQVRGRYLGQREYDNHRTADIRNKALANQRLVHAPNKQPSTLVDSNNTPVLSEDVIAPELIAFGNPESSALHATEGKHSSSHQEGLDSKVGRSRALLE